MDCKDLKNSLFNIQMEILKVSKSQKQFLELSILPKKRTKALKKLS